MDTLKAKHLQRQADSGCERVARLVLIWATGAGVHPGVGVGCGHPRSRPGTHREGIGTGACGGISSVYVRGSDPNFTVVLIDGVKVNDPTNSRGGSVDFSTLSTDNIERIEIVRGPLSAVYGSDALGGVINIITRRGTGVPNGSVEVSAGRFDAYRTLLQANGTLGVMDYAVSGSYLDNGRPVEGSRFLGATLQPWPYLSTTAHLTYLQTDIKGTTELLRNRPKWRGGFAAQWSPRPDLDVHLHTIVVGSVPDSSIPTGARMLDAYARVDLAVNWTLTRHWQVFVAVDNLFDASYEEFIGFPAPGVSPRAGVWTSF